MKGCEQDAKDMAAIARKQKFAASILLNEKATADAVKVAISTAAGWPSRSRRKAAERRS